MCILLLNTLVISFFHQGNYKETEVVVSESRTWGRDSLLLGSPRSASILWWLNR